MKKKKIVISVTALLVLIALCIGGTLAWFINYGTNKVDGTTVTVSAGNVMELSLDGTNYSGTLKKDDFAAKKLNMKDITGDGVTFLRPVLGESQVAADGKDVEDSTYLITVAEPDFNATWLIPMSTADCEVNQQADYSNADYISFTLYFRATTQMAVYLTSDSYVRPFTETGNYSSYAATDSQFSKDWIAAASRIAFVDSNEQVRMLWAPQADRELYYDTDSTNKGYKMRQNQGYTPKSDDYYYYRNAESGSGYEKRYYRIFNALTQNSSDAGTGNRSYTDIPLYTKISTNLENQSAAESPVAELSYNNTTGYYEGSVTVNIWVEGCDREAKRALAGGNIDFSLVFAGFETKSASEGE